MNNVLSPRDRKALGAEYRYYKRVPLDGEAPPRTISHQPWQPLRDLAWQPMRPGAADAMGVQSAGLPT